MVSRSEVEEVADMLSEIQPRLQSDIEAIKEELKKEGYNVLAIFPRDVSLTRNLGRLGFSVTIPEDKEKELLKILRRNLRGILNVELGVHKKLAVFVVTVRYPTVHWALLYPVYYHTEVEWLIKEFGKQGLFTFFKTEKTDMVGWLSMGNYQLYLHSRYTKA